ncbi:hypothetical protein ACOMHN_031807 [Nucella lapillus]
MELGILHNSPPSTKRGCRAGRLHRLWHGLPPAPWPCTRSQHHSVPSRNLHPLMVPPFLQPHPDLQSAVGNAPLSSKHPAQLPTTDCLLSITSPMGGQPSDAPALSPPSPLQQGGQSSNAPALSPPSPLPQGGQPIALALSPPSPPPQGGQPSDAPGLSPSSSTLLLVYSALQTGCVHKVLNQTRCAIRDPLFLAAVDQDYLEALYSAGCVPRPATTSRAVETTTLDATTPTPTTSESTAPETTTAETTTQPATTTTPEENPTTRNNIIPRQSSIWLSTPPPHTTGAIGDPSVSEGSDVTAASCDVRAARACIHQRQSQVDKAASARDPGGDALVNICLATELEDRVTRCFHNNTEGCREGELSFKMATEMWRDTAKSVHTLCHHTCKQYRLAFQCFKSVVPEPLSLLCESRKMAVRCVPCPLAANMLHVLIKSTVPQAHIHICETGQCHD